MMDISEMDYHSLAYVVKNMRESDRLAITSTHYPSNDESLLTRDDLFIQDLFDSSTRSGAGWVAKKDGEPIAVFGLTMMWPGVASVWLYATDSFEKLAFPLTRWIKSMMIPFMNDAGIHRAQCTVMGNCQKTDRFLHLLGSVREGYLLGYGQNNQPFHLHGWVKGRNF